MSSFNNFLPASIGALQINAQNIPIIITFCLYLVGMLIIGIYFMKKSNNLEGYLLGGRSMGSWVTALSTQASDMSGWLLMGLPGAIYLGGVGQSWIGIGLVTGTFFNWLIVAPRLRIYTEQNKSLTISTFIAKRFEDKYRITQILSSIIILFFFTIYVASGLVATGKLFNSILSMDYNTAVLMGAAVLVIYTLLGGFLAVCWTDLFQGILMFFALLIVPIMAYSYLGSGSVSATEVINTAAEAKNISLSLFEFTNKDNTIQNISLLAICSSFAWGLGYFGMPHVIVRFMSIKSHKELPKAMSIAMTWVIVSLVCLIIIGVLGMAMYATPPNGDKEQIFIQMIKELFNPWIGGVLLAAILAATMSTTDSQLLVCSSSLTEDIYAVLFHKKAKEKELLWISRACIVIVAIIAMALAFSSTKGSTGKEKSILDLVSYSWAGFGATFGPVILCALYSRKTTWYSALTGIIVGGITLILWPEINDVLQTPAVSDFFKTNGYEISQSVTDFFGIYVLLPGFIFNFIAIMIINAIAPQKNSDILNNFSKMIDKLKGSSEEKA